MGDNTYSIRDSLKVLAQVIISLKKMYDRLGNDIRDINCTREIDLYSEIESLSKGIEENSKELEKVRSIISKYEDMLNEYMVSMSGLSRLVTKIIIFSTTIMIVILSMLVLFIEEPLVHGSLWIALTIIAYIMIIIISVAIYVYLRNKLMERYNVEDIEVKLEELRSKAIEIEKELEVMNNLYEERLSEFSMKNYSLCTCYRGLSSLIEDLEHMYKVINQFIMEYSSGDYDKSIRLMNTLYNIMRRILKKTLCDTQYTRDEYYVLIRTNILSFKALELTREILGGIKKGINIDKALSEKKELYELYRSIITGEVSIPIEIIIRRKTYTIPLIESIIHYIVSGI